MDSATVPMVGISGFVAMMAGVLATLFAGIWWRGGRDPGMPWLCAGFALAAAWYYSSADFPPGGPLIATAQERGWSIVIGAAVLCVASGVARYLGLPEGRWRWLVWACGVPGLTLMAMLAIGIPVAHHSFHIGVLLAYLGAAVLAFRRAVTDRGDGHAVLGTALLLLAAAPYLLAFAGMPPAQLQYVAGALLTVFGLVLLTVSLLRRQRALGFQIDRRQQAEAMLREANTRLEAQVSERTAHLRELIIGLQAFNRGVSHDLRGPLGGMSNLARLAAEAMERGDVGPAQRALPLIARQCDASVQMVSTMLELARIGDMPVRREPVCLSDIARSAYDEVTLGMAEVERPALHCSPMPQVQSDPNLLRPVFVNLIGNAVKFTRGRPSPRIDIDADVSGQDIAVCVHDNGVGFEADKADRLFEPFFRAHSASHEGHGLGLSIVRRAVEAMGGTVWARVNAAGGASLCFRILGAVGPARCDASPLPVMSSA